MPTQRMLRLSVGHYKKENKSEAEGHAFSQHHAAKAAAIHARHGIQMYALYQTPSATRNVLAAMNAQMNRGWVIDDHDVVVEFYFHDLAAVQAVGMDPEFQTLQAEEADYVSSLHVTASLGWVEVYVQDGKVLNVADGKSTYGNFEETCDITTPAGSDS